MRILKTGEVWKIESAFEERDRVKAVRVNGAGAWWHGLPCSRPRCQACAAGLGKTWWTADPAVASAFGAYAEDEATRRGLEAIVGARREAIDASRATDADLEIPCPPGLSYMPFQKAGIAYALGRANVLIGDSMGLGKTPVSVGLLNILKPYRVLVVCPASLRINWQREVARWSTRPLRVGIVEGSKYPKDDPDVVIVNYDVLVRHLDALTARSWDVLIADELHYAKNIKAQRSKALYSIPAKKKIGLTGTPICNRPIEFWAIAHWLAPAEFPSWKRYVDRYCNPETIYTPRGPVTTYTGASNLEELQARARGSCLPGTAVVVCEDGKRTIGEIVHSGYRGKVLGLGPLGWDWFRVVRGIERRRWEPYVRITTDNGRVLVCTAGHRIWCGGRWTKASKVEVGQAVRVVRDTRLHETESNLSPVLHESATREETKSLPYVRGQIRSGERGPSVLSARMREEDITGPVSGVQEGFSATSGPDFLQREVLVNGGLSVARVISKQECTDKSNGGWATGQCPSSSDSTEIIPENVEIPDRLVPKARVAGDQDGVVYFRRRTSLGRGPSRTEAQDCRRGGRGAAYERSVSNETGPAKGMETGFGRVGRVEVLESYGPLEYRRGGSRNKGTDTVFDIQVEVAECFVADGFLVHNCMIRRTKDEVLLELPAKRRQIIPLAWNGASAAVRRLNAEWEAREAKVATLRVAALGAATDEEYKAAVKALSDAEKIAFEEISTARRELAIEKVPKALEHISDLLDEEAKCCVFAHHHAVVELLAEGLAEFRPVVLTGETSMRDRQAAVDAFQNDPNVRVFIGSIMAAGVGLTLTAASTAVFVELDWVPGNVTQAEDRLHRIGQTAPVLIQHLVFDDSLDSHLAKVLVEKQEVIDRALDKGLVLPELAAFADTAPVKPSVPRAIPSVSPEVRAAVHEALAFLAAHCDGARTQDGCGFNRMDAAFGRQLSLVSELTDRQFHAGQKLIRKYRGQLGESLAQRAGVAQKEE